MQQSFGSKQDLLERLNEMAYELPLSQAEVKKLSAVNDKWQKLQGDCKTRHSGLQVIFSVILDLNEMYLEILHAPFWSDFWEL